MKNNIFILSAALILGMLSQNVQARVLSPEEALSRAVTSEKAPARARALNPKALKPSLIIQDKSQLPALYVFNQSATANDGFMVVAADDAVVNPVLGYAETGSIDDENIAPACRAWLDEYARQIKWLRDNNIGAPIVPTGAVQIRELQRAKRDQFVHALCTTKWNQSAPFYNMTPTYNGKHCVTGCTATCMAQILKYYNWPPKGTGTHSYTWTTYGSQTVSFNFDQNPFDWDNMKDVYTGNESPTETDAVANLMLACGVLSEMSYSVSSSGANLEIGMANVLTYLGYARTAHAVEREYYTIEQWEDLIYNNIFEYGPTPMTGFNEDSGHAFVCDGYVKAGYFHFNWGWGGTSDGLFELTALDPGQQGIGGSADGYDYNMGAVLGIQVPKAGQTYDPVYVMRGKTNTSLTVNTSNKTLTSTYIWNNSLYTIPYVGRGVKVTNLATNEETYYYSDYTTKLQWLHGWSSYSVALPSLPDGTYLVSPAFKLGSSSATATWRDAELCEIGPKSCTVTYKNGAITSAETNEPYCLEFENVTQRSRVSVYQPFYMTMDVTNPNDGEYYSSVAMVVLNDELDGNIGRGLYNTMLVPAHQTVEWDYMSTLYEFTTTTIPTGTRFVTPVDLDGRMLTPNAFSIEVTDAPSSYGTISYVSDFALADSYKQAPTVARAASDPVVATYDLTFTGTLKNTGGYHTGAPRVYFFKDGETSSGDYASYNNVFLEDGETHIMNFNCKFGNAEEGKRYYAVLFSPNSNGSYVQKSNAVYFTAGSVTGVADIESDSAAEVVSSTYFNLSGAELPSRPEQPGLYLRRDLLKDGSTITTRETIH